MKNTILQNDRTSPASYDLFLATLRPVSRENREMLENCWCSATTSGVCLDAEIERRMIAGSEVVIGGMKIFPGGNIRYLNHEADVSEQRAKNQQAIKLLQKWMGDAKKADYDRKVWPVVKNLIEDNRLSERKRFSE